MHFTIDSSYSPGHNPKLRTMVAINTPVYVVGHSIGGVTRHIVDLGNGDTADNPASTKELIYGPAFVVYDVFDDGGTNASVFENAKAFYNSFKTAIPVADIDAIINYCWEDEARDYEQCEQPENENETTGHIFETLRRVAFWLAGTKGA